MCMCMCVCVCVWERERSMLWSPPAVHTLAAWSWITWPRSIHLPCCSSFTPFSLLLKAELFEPLKRVVFSSLSRLPYKLCCLFALSSSRFIYFQPLPFLLSHASDAPHLHVTVSHKSALCLRAINQLAGLSWSSCSFLILPSIILIMFSS